MKERNGFVSNSSSSSFVLVGEPASMMTLTEKDIESGLVVTGKYLSEGLDVFSISSAGVLKFIQDHPGPFVIYKNAQLHSSGDMLVEVDVEGPVTVVGGTRDQNSCGDIDTLFDRYDELIEDELQVTASDLKERLKDQYT